MVRSLGLIAALLVVVVVAGCGSTPDAQAPAPGAGTSAPAGVPTDSGGELYTQNCARCHGAALDGTDQGPPLIHEYYVPGHHPDIAFMAAIRIGVRPHHWNFGSMPPVEGLTDAEAEAIIAFVREQQRAAGLID